MTTYRSRHLRIGAMRHRITIQTPTELQDQYGEPIVTWEDRLVNEPAQWDARGGNETMRGRQVEASISGIFTVRYRDDYNTQQKVVYNGRSYGIKYAEPVEGGRRFIDLYVVASGDL